MKMNPIKLLLTIDWNARSLRIFDFLLAGLAIAIGLYLDSQIWFWGGVFGFVLSLINPMGRLQKGLFKFRKPRSK